MHSEDRSGSPLGFLQDSFSGYEPFNLSNGETVQVPVYALRFPRWHGPSIRNTFGGKPLVDVDGTPQFAEVAIARYMQGQGLSARWVETYGRGTGLPKFLSSWKDAPYADQDECPIRDPRIMQCLSEIAERNGGTYAGCWDVVGWKNGATFFFESKRLKRDRLRGSQRNWLDAAVRSGIDPSDFGLVEWDFDI